MGFRFRRRIKVAPGLRINLSKSGPSVSIGEPGATVNVGRKRRSVTVGIPGTGLSYQKRLTSRRPVHKHPVTGLILGLCIIWVLFHLI